MGAKILLHFSKGTLTTFPLIIEGYRAEGSATAAELGNATGANLPEFVEEKLLPVEEISSTCVVST